MVPRGPRPPGRLSLPGTAGKPCRRLPVFRARHQPWRAQRTTQSCAGHISSRPREGGAARSGGLPGRGGRGQGPGRQAGEPPQPAAPQPRRTCPAGDCPPAPPVPLTGGQDFLARPRAKPRDNDTAPRGPLWTFHGPAAGLRLTSRPGAAPGVRVKYPCHQRTRRARVTLRWRGSRSRGDRPHTPILLYKL